MADPARRDESVDQLEALLAQLREARHDLGASQAQLDDRSDELAGEVDAAGARLQAVAQALAALYEGFGALHAETQGILAALTHAAGGVADGRLTATRGALSTTQHHFRTGQAQARELLDTADAEWEHEFGESDTSLDALDAQAADLGEESELAFADLQGRVGATDGAVRDTVNEIAAAVDASAEYLGQALEPYLAAAFVALDSHLDREATPFLVDAFADVGRSLLRAFDEYDTLVEGASQDLVGSTEPLLKEAARAGDRLREGAETTLQQAEDRGLHPLAEEADQHQRAVMRGQEIASDLPPLLPQLATAREVAERVQELMDVFNPFG